MLVAGEDRRVRIYSAHGVLEHTLWVGHPVASSSFSARFYSTQGTYSTETYLEVLLTYSGHRLLQSDLREGLLACIAALIDTRYEGSITKRYLTELRTARLR